MIDTHLIIKVIMYAKQHYFEHYDKPGKQLACVLLDTSICGPSVPSQQSKGKLATTPIEKLQIFAEYYELYALHNLLDGESEMFLSKIVKVLWGRASAGAI